MKNVVKILTALATIAGAVYIIATYGDKIVAWAQKIWDAMPKKAAVELEVDLSGEETEEAAAPEAEAAEEAAAEEVPVAEAEEEAPEVIVAEHEPVAAEEDFAE